MDGTTEGICQASYAIREYHHMLKERYTTCSSSQLCCTGRRQCQPPREETGSDRNEDVQMGMRPHTKRDHVRNDDIRERLEVENITERYRRARLRSFSHVKRRDQEYVGRTTLEMVPPGRRKRGRQKQRWVDCVNRDMRAIATTKDEVHDRTGWRRIVSAAATPQPSGSG